MAERTVRGRHAVWDGACARAVRLQQVYGPLFTSRIIDRKGLSGDVEQLRRKVSPDDPEKPLQLLAEYIEANRETESAPRSQVEARDELLNHRGILTQRATGRNCSLPARHVREFGQRGSRHSSFVHNRRRRCVVLLASMLLLCVSGCRKRETIAGVADVESAGNNHGLTLDQDRREQLGIVLSPVRSESVRATQSAVGWLVNRPGIETIVRAPAAGFVLPDPNSRWPESGDSVTADQVLAQLNIFLSPQEISQLVLAKEDNDIQMQQALVTMELSQAQLKLAANARDAVTGVRIDQLKEAYERAKVANKEAQDKLPFLIREPYEEGALVKPVSVKSSGTGRILRIHLSPGQYVQSGDSLWTVAGWSTLWLRVPVFESEMTRIDRKASAIGRGASSDSKIAIEPLDIPVATNSGTRTVDVCYAVGNPEWKYRVGQSIQVELPTSMTEDAMLIPRSAVLYDVFGQASCFAGESDADEFHRRRIELGAIHHDDVIVIRGLDKDDVADAAAGYR